MSDILPDDFNKELPSATSSWIQSANLASHMDLSLGHQQKIMSENNNENIEIDDHLITCSKHGEKCEEKVLKEYLKKENKKLESENKLLNQRIIELEGDKKFISAEHNKAIKKKKKAEQQLNKIIKRMENIIDSFNGVNADVHTSLMVKLFRNAIKIEYSENKIIKEIKKLRNPVERRLDGIED